MMDIAALCRSVFPAWKVAILKEVDGGRSQARVAVVDFVPDVPPAGATTPPELTSGQYILKVQQHTPWPGEDPESSRHEVAVNRSPEFSSRHIPRLRFSTEKDGLALL